MKITIYNSNTIEKPNNNFYPNKHELDTSAEIDSSIFAHDYVGPKFNNSTRSANNLISTNCVIVDIDNSHSENPSDWVNRDDVEKLLGNVAHIIHYSRNHMRDKKVVSDNGTVTIKQKRPKMHIIIATSEITSKEEYDDLINRLFNYLPVIDEKAKDVAHFFFGTAEPAIEVIDGKLPLNELLDELDFDSIDTDVIEEGSRNPTMHKYAIKVLKRYGDSEEAINLFNDKATHCNPLLPDSELNTIWKSALTFYNKVITADPNYKKPGEYEDNNDYHPIDNTDLGQALLIQKYFINQIRYSAATLSIVYRGNKWEESEIGAQGIVQELTNRQKKQAIRELAAAKKRCEELGVFGAISAVPKTKIELVLADEQKEAFDEYSRALNFRDYVLKRRSSHSLAGTQREMRPLIEINQSELDANPFLLNTPDGTYDLRHGVKGKREHRSEDLITKITSVSPSTKGKDMWLNCVNTIFGNNQPLIDYVQEMCGMALYGKVYFEGCIIAYGDGGNGKSTFFNAVSGVLGNYSGVLASDVLTTTIKRDRQAELAELRGKRLVISAETKAGDIFDESTIKRMCSTDSISACKKFKNPFDFKPSHTLVIYTNNLPKISTMDEGTWRRIIVIPFNHKFSGKEDIKNYADVLIEEAGEYILYWLMEGAMRAFAKKFKIEQPAVVINAIMGYKVDNDNIARFFNEYADTSNSKALCPSGELYRRYRSYCYECGESAKSTTDFYNSIKKMGFSKIKKNSRFYIKGVSLSQLTSSSADEDFEGLL